VVALHWNPMRLLTGPAGAGKTAIALDEFREALRSGRSDVRLLTPTATMAQHFENQLAREGFVFRGWLIQTLHEFAEQWLDVPQVSDAVLALLVEQAATRVNRGEFARVAHMPGFCAALASRISEFASAGCDSARLAHNLPEAPLAAAFLAAYREVDRELESRGMALRARRLEMAAGRIGVQGLGGIRAIWMDGFHALPDPELGLIAAVGNRASLTLTMSESDLHDDLRGRLASMGFVEEHAVHGRRAPAEILVAAKNAEREVEEIVRRILEQRQSGLVFREMGIIVRTERPYVPLLQTALARAGIPAHFYFDARLAEHAVVRYLTGAMGAMLSGWEHQRTLAVLRLAPRFADWNALDSLDFAVRQQIPNAGLGELKSLLVGAEGHPLPGAEPLLHKLDSLAMLEEWRRFSLTPRDWALRLRDLRHVFRPAPDPLPEGEDRHRAALELRSQAVVLDLLDESLDEAAQALPRGREMALEPFWRAVESVLRLKPLRVRDYRRDVVHVMPAHEARQWVLKAVFVCGLVERQFPQFHPQDLFFPDAARRRLNAAGIRVRTTADFDREERALFDSALGRARQQVVLTYPECDARGEQTLRSLYLEGRAGMRIEQARTAAPAPRRARPPQPQTGIRAPSLLQQVKEKSARLSATSLEKYLQCPFEFFGARTLKLQGPPEWPEKRLGFLEQGNIVHRVLAEWWPRRAAPIAPIFERVFEEFREATRLPESYHSERLRNAILADLEMFAADDQWPAGYGSRQEEPFTLHLETHAGEPIEITGKIDRLDTDANGRAYVIDYKYSAAARVRSRLGDDRLLQAQLYGMGAEQAFGVKPVGMFYLGVKGKIQYVGWSDENLLTGEPFPAGWFEQARERTLGVIEQIRAGRVEPDPADLKHCEYCDFRDACRVEPRKAALIPEALEDVALDGAAGGEME